MVGEAGLSWHTAAPKAKHSRDLPSCVTHLWLEGSSTSLSTSPSSSSDEMPRFCRRDEWTSVKSGKRSARTQEKGT